MVQFSLTSFVVMALIAVVLAFVLAVKVETDATTDLVEEAVGHASGRLLRTLTPADLDAPMTGERYLSFHEFVQNSVVSERTVRVKLWSRNGTVIYSDDASAVGDQFPDNPALLKALSGEEATEIIAAGDPENLGERSLGRLMEVYTPIVYPGEPTPVGAFEIYQDYEPTAKRIASLRFWTIGAIGMGFLVLYGGLISIVWRGWNTITSQRARLESFNAHLEIQVQERTRELTEAHEQLRDYTNQVEELTRTRERNRLARELHDSVTQDLYGQTMYTEAACRQILAGDNHAALDNLEQVQKATKEALKEMRLLIFELQPSAFQPGGLAAALRSRLQAVENRSGISTEFHTNLKAEDQLPSHVEELFYSVGREALNNSLKHAQAGNLKVSLVREAALAVMEIMDDGIGFQVDESANSGGFGLSSMAERAAAMGGTLTVKSTPGRGTQVRVEVNTCQDR